MPTHNCGRQWTRFPFLVTCFRIGLVIKKKLNAKSTRILGTRSVFLEGYSNFLLLKITLKYYNFKFLQGYFCIYLTIWSSHTFMLSTMWCELSINCLDFWLFAVNKIILYKSYNIPFHICHIFISTGLKNFKI